VTLHTGPFPKFFNGDFERRRPSAICGKVIAFNDGAPEGRIRMNKPLPLQRFLLTAVIFLLVTAAQARRSGHWLDRQSRHFPGAQRVRDDFDAG